MFERLLTLARPYAQSAFDFAVEHQALNEWEFMLCSAKNIIKNEISSKLLACVHFIEPTQLSEILLSIGKHDFDCYGQNFIRIIANYKKLYLLPTIFQEFVNLRKKQERVFDIQVITINPLVNDQLLHITSIIKKKLMCKKVNITCQLDQSIIGGIIIKINDIVIDGSIRNHLKRLQDILKTENYKVGITCD